MKWTLSLLYLLDHNTTGDSLPINGEERHLLRIIRQKSTLNEGNESYESRQQEDVRATPFPIFVTRGKKSLNLTVLRNWKDAAVCSDRNKGRCALGTRVTFQLELRKIKSDIWQITGCEQATPSRNTESQACIIVKRKSFVGRCREVSEHNLAFRTPWRCIGRFEAEFHAFLTSGLG